jgi:hypothetical protein
VGMNTTCKRENKAGCGYGTKVIGKEFRRKAVGEEKGVGKNIYLYDSGNRFYKYGDNNDCIIIIIIIIITVNYVIAFSA